MSDVVYMCKTGIKDAFRMLPITIRDQPKLGFKFRDEVNFHKTLPMGRAMSCKSFATALEHIFKFYDLQCHVIYYLNALFLFIVPNNYVRILKTYLCHCVKKSEFCYLLNKTTNPDTKTRFIAIELDPCTQSAKLPLDKLNSYYIDVYDVSQKRTSTKRHLQSTIGKLSFAASVIPERAFLRRLLTYRRQLNARIIL